jgi:acyl dehydratase
MLLPKGMASMPGLHFEEFEPGQVFSHSVRRTVTETDNVLFSTMTMNPQPLHLDRHFCETETEWGQPLVNSLFTLGLMIGISVGDTTLGTTIANLGMTEVRFPRSAVPGRHGARHDGGCRQTGIAVAAGGRDCRVRAQGI